MVYLSDDNVEVKSSGFLQVYVNGEFGSVCNMNKADADSACRQLGYTNSIGVENMEPIENGYVE